MNAPTTPTAQGATRATSKTITDTRPSLSLNWEEWLPYLEDSTATDAEKRALIEALWTIVLGFVDLGWDIREPGTLNPDQSPETGGQHLDLTAALRAAVINSKDTSTKEEL